MKFIQKNKIQDKVEKIETYLKTTKAFISNFNEDGGQTYYGGYSLIESSYDNKNKKIWFVGINCGTGYKGLEGTDLKSLCPISEVEFQEQVDSNLFIRKISELFSDQAYELTSYNSSYFISNLHFFATYDEATLKEYISESNLGSEINREYISLIKEINFNIFQELKPKIIIAIGRQVRQAFNKIFKEIDIEFEDEKNYEYEEEDSRHWLYKTRYKGEDVYFIDALRGRRALRNSKELAKKIKVILSKT